MIRNILLSIFLLVKIVCNAQNNLNYYIENAKINSPLLYDAINQNKINEFEIARINATYTKPLVGVTANYMFAPIINLDNNKSKFEPNSIGADKYVGYDFAAANGGTYQALLNITQPIFNTQKLQTANQQVKIASQINFNNSKLAAHDLEKIVTDQYILCIQNSLQTNYAQAMLGILTEQKDMLTKLVQASIYKQSDLTLLNIEYQTTLAQLITFKANYKRDLIDLNILCGIADTAIVQLQNIELNITNNNATSMFLQKYDLDSLNLMAQQKNFELKYKPQLSLFANTGLNAVYAPTIPNRFGVSAGFSFTYNFFDGNQKNINQNKTSTSLQTVTKYKSYFLNQNNLRKHKIYTELQSYKVRIGIAKQQLQDYDVLLNSYKKEIMLGQLSIINYVTVLKNLATANRDYTLLFTQQQSIINAYNYWNW